MRSTQLGVSRPEAISSSAITPGTTSASLRSNAARLTAAQRAAEISSSAGGFRLSGLPATFKKPVRTGPGHDCVTTTPVPASSVRSASVNAVTWCLLPT